PAYAHLGSLEFAKKLLLEAKVCVSPGIGFGDYGDDHVRFALIENQDRTRQAIRGIKAMFRSDGLLPPTEPKARRTPSTCPDAAGLATNPPRARSLTGLCQAASQVEPAQCCG